VRGEWSEGRTVDGSVSEGQASLDPMSEHEPLRIECRSCIHDGTSQCDDCVVSFLLDRDQDTVVVDAEEARALRRLGEAGLVPLLKLTPKPTPGGDPPSEEAG
jgi:hypothetical protein